MASSTVTAREEYEGFGDSRTEIKLRGCGNGLKYITVGFILSIDVGKEFFQFAIVTSEYRVSIIDAAWVVEGSYASERDHSITERNHRKVQQTILGISFSLTYRLLVIRLALSSSSMVSNRVIIFLFSFKLVLQGLASMIKTTSLLRDVSAALSSTKVPSGTNEPLVN